MPSGGETRGRPAPPRRGRGGLAAALVCLAALSPGCGASRPAGGWTTWGVTIDDPWDAPAQAAALAALPVRPSARVVLDVGPAAEEYVAPLATIRAEAAVMAALVDSFELAAVPPEAYEARAREFVARLGPLVDVWEIGNEVNGGWTGDAGEVARKAAAAHAAVKAAGGATALTLFYNRGCATAPEHEAFRWAAEHLPARLRGELDYVWLSWHEEDCPGVEPDWRAAFEELAALFPAARLGIGECGARDPARKLDALRRCYAIESPHPRFVGGGYWWYFSSDMVPPTRPLWSALAEIIAARTGNSGRAGHR